MNEQTRQIATKKDGQETCQWRGNEPCHKHATVQLNPKHGVPTKLCHKHYNWLRFLAEEPTTHD